MKVFKRIDGEIGFTDLISQTRIRVELEDGTAFDIYEDHGMLEIMKIDGSLSITPSVSNVIRID